MTWGREMSSKACDVAGYGFPYLRFYCILSYELIYVDRLRLADPLGASAGRHIAVLYVLTCCIGQSLGFRFLPV